MDELLALGNEHDRTVEPAPGNVADASRGPTEVVSDEQCARPTADNGLGDIGLVGVTDQVECGATDEGRSDQDSGSTCGPECLAQDGCLDESRAAASERMGNEDSGESGLDQRRTDTRRRRCTWIARRCGEPGVQDLADDSESCCCSVVSSKSTIGTQFVAMERTQPRPNRTDLTIQILSAIVEICPTGDAIVHCCGSPGVRGWLRGQE